MLGISFKQVPHIYHHVGRQGMNIPKGCLKIKVGQGEEQQKITVPVNYLKHPLFIRLLKEAEEEYGFAQKGTITIPCQVADFKNVQHFIHRERSLQVPCFRAS
ncbi:Auxin-responsive protein SAUR32, partial [Mucuna pruriens]